MANLLKINATINYFIMVFILCVMWFNKFYFMLQPSEEHLSSYFFMYEIESIIWKYCSACIALVIYLFLAILINRHNLKLSILPTAYQTTGIFFLIASGFFLNTQRIIPEMLSSIFMYCAFFKLFYTYGKDYKIYNRIFDIGFLFGVSILSSHKFIFFFPLLIYIFIVIRTNFRFKELIIMLLGIFAPIVLITSIVYLYFDYEAYVDYIKMSIIQTKIRFTVENIYVFSPIIIITIMIMIYDVCIKTAQKIFTRKIRNIFAVCNLYIIILFMTPIFNNELIISLYVPLSFFLSKVYIKSTNIVRITLFYGLIIIVILLQIIQIRSIIY